MSVSSLFNIVILLEKCFKILVQLYNFTQNLLSKTNAAERQAMFMIWFGMLLIWPGYLYTPLWETAREGSRRLKSSFATHKLCCITLVKTPGYHLQSSNKYTLMTSYDYCEDQISKKVKSKYKDNLQGTIYLNTLLFCREPCILNKEQTGALF